MQNLTGKEMVDKLKSLDSSELNGFLLDFLKDADKEDLDEVIEVLRKDKDFLKDFDFFQNTIFTKKDGTITIDPLIVRFVLELLDPTLYEPWPNMDNYNKGILTLIGEIGLSDLRDNWLDPYGSYEEFFENYYNENNLGPIPKTLINRYRNFFKRGYEIRYLPTPVNSEMVFCVFLKTC